MINSNYVSHPDLYFNMKLNKAELEPKLGNDSLTFYVAKF